MGYVFTGRDAVCTFRDGNREGSRAEFTVTFANADLRIERVQEVVPIVSRGSLSHYRRDQEERAKVYLSYRYSSKELAENIMEHLTVKSTSSEIDEFCQSPSDYNDPWWTKTNIQEPIGNNGLAPNGIDTAQRLVPTAGRGYISCSAEVDPEIGEFLFLDCWLKAETPHTAALGANMTYHGPPPTPPEWYAPIGAWKHWYKFTAGYINQSTVKVPETVYFTIYTDDAPGVPVGKPLDVWGVSIRREKTTVQTWDLNIDVYKGGVLERTIVLEHVLYRELNFDEDDDGSIWTLELDSRLARPYEILV